MSIPLGLASAGAQTPKATTPPQCFNPAVDYSGWRSTPDARTIYLRVGANRAYRVDLATACPALRWAYAQLVMSRRGGPWVCDGVDLGLSVSDGDGFVTPCIVSKITPLTPDERMDLPKALRP